MKSDIPAHLYVAKRGYISKSGQVEVTLYILYKLKNGCRWHITSAFPYTDSVDRGLYARKPLALAVVSLRAFRAVTHARVHSTIAFCLVFSQKFNIMSAISGHQSPTLPQKIDPREGWFWCKKGIACERGKMNFYLKTPPFVPVIGLFAAKCTAIWCKTHCNMVQNAVHFGAKYSAFWC